MEGGSSVDWKHEIRTFTRCQEYYDHRRSWVHVSIGGEQPRGLDSNCASSACWLVRHLTLTYPHAYNIVSFDKLDYCASLNNTRVLNDKRNFSFYHGDITNPSEVMDCLERHNIDTIFHFAAQSHVDLSFGNSYAFTHTNVYGTHVLLESAKKVGIKKFIHISTDEVYGEVRDDADDLLETSILAPTNPYAASKAAAEMLVHSYQKSFKLPVIIVRSNNVYGPHQFPESKSYTSKAHNVVLNAI